MYTADSNPLPASRTQLRALVGAAARELTWTQRAVSRQIRGWSELARTIPDAQLREAALSALRTKRGHANGAALFTVLPTHRDPDLLAVLVAFQLIWDYLDSAHELAPDERNGRQLHLALVDALAPGQPMRDWYRHSPWRDDGGYLAALVGTCRMAALRLPSYARVQPRLLQSAWRGQVLALNHLVDPRARDAALRRWAAEEFPDERELAWYELSSAASAGLVVHALLALAARPGVTEAQVAAAQAAYWPWVSLSATLLDSYVDRDADVRNGDHSYIAHYPSEEAAVARIHTCIGRSAAAVRGLSRSGRHATIVACMVALYLSKDGANASATRASTKRLINSGGSLTRLLAPVLRLWRLRYEPQAR